MKPEFRIQKQLVDNKYPQNNVTVKAGELIGRLYYPKGFEASGQITLKDKGIKVLYDSRKSEKPFGNFNNTVRIILFVAPAATMIELYESGLFAPSNMAGAEQETAGHILAIKESQPVAADTSAVAEVVINDEIASAEHIKVALNTLTITELKAIAKGYELGANPRSRKATLVKKLVQALASEQVTRTYVEDLVAHFNRGVA